MIRRHCAVVATLGITGDPWTYPQCGGLGIASDPRSYPQSESLGITGDPETSAPRRSLGIIHEMSGDHPRQVWGSPVIRHQPIPTITNQTRRVADFTTQLTTARTEVWSS